jgi:hypothetical protein
MSAAPPHSFATIAAQPPFPNELKLSPTKSAIATASLGFTSAIRKHQDNFLTLFCSSTGTATILGSKIEQLRAGNVTQMTSATTCVQQASGTRFSLERLYKLPMQKKRWCANFLPRKF